MATSEVIESRSSSFASYEWGKVINFGLRGNAGAYTKSGWSDPETGMVWTNALNCRMAFSVPAPTTDITMVANWSPFIAKGIIDQQEVHLYVNFMRVDFLTVTDGKPVELVIPKFVLANSQCYIDFYIPSARSPFELGLNPDIRRLGLAMSRLVLIQG